MVFFDTIATFIQSIAGWIILTGKSVAQISNGISNPVVAGIVYWLIRIPVSYTHLKGDNFLIVYADDFVAGFQYKWEAENYYKLLKERMEKFGLQLEDSKSRLLQSGAYIARAKQKSGESIRLQTFDFLGFTFYCGRSRKGMPYICLLYTSRCV